MCSRMAVRTPGNQILFCIGSRMTSELDVMYVQLFHAAANLASPGVAFQHLPMQFAIAGRIHSESRALAADPLSIPFSITALNMG